MLVLTSEKIVFIGIILWQLFVFFQLFQLQRLPSRLQTVSSQFGIFTLLMCIQCVPAMSLAHSLCKLNNLSNPDNISLTLVIISLHSSCWLPSLGYFLLQFAYLIWIKWKWTPYGQTFCNVISSFWLISSTDSFLLTFLTFLLWTYSP